MKILYPGTFDPLTNGHLDLIQRAEKLFGNVVVAVLENTSKKPTFDLNKRILQIKNAVSHLSNISVISYEGLTVDCAKEVNANTPLGSKANDIYNKFCEEGHSNKDFSAISKVVGGDAWDYEIDN